MAENTYTLKLIIEAVNQYAPVFQDAAARMQSLGAQARQASDLTSQAGAAVKEKFEQVAKRHELPRSSSGQSP